MTGVGAGEGERGALPTAALLLPIGTLETGGGAGETGGGLGCRGGAPWNGGYGDNSHIPDPQRGTGQYCHLVLGSMVRQ